MKSRALLLCLALCTSAVAQDTLAQDTLAQDTLDLDAVKRIVAEIATVSPPNPAYIYPLNVKLDPSPAINAGAGYYWYGDNKDEKYAQLVVNEGLLEAPGCNELRLRAILAHELAHLALGHALVESFEGDTLHALTRQQELEADRVGADYLVALGHDRGEMADAILWLGQGADSKAMPWITSVSGDHASPVMRAALLEPSDRDLEAVALFEHGLMYVECGQQRAALPFFDLALAKQPALYEASIMGARAALQDYYERLPLRIQEAWLRPDFGPMLTDARLLAGRSTELTDADRRRYAQARARIEAIPDGIYVWMKMFLLSTADVLHPDGNQAALEAGISSLHLLHGLELMQDTGGVEELLTVRQRYANNLALGLQRAGRTGEARSLLLTEMAPRQARVLAITGNIAELPLQDLNEEQTVLVIDLLVHFLRNTPPGAQGHERARDTLTALLERAQLSLNNEIVSPEVVFCAVVEARLGDELVGLFDPASQLQELLGKPAQEQRPIEQYPDLGKLQWGEDAQVLAVVERGRIVRLSSKREGDAVLLRPANQGVRGRFEVRVGMTEQDLRALVDPAGDGGLFERLALLAGPGSFEVWTYYPTLNFGVLLEDGLVAGVTVTPVKG